MKKILSFLLIGFFAFSFIACEEEDSILGTPSDDDMQPAQDNIEAEKGIMSAANYMNPYGLDEELKAKGFSADGPTYSWISITDFKLKIDFTNVSGMGGAIIVDYDSNPLAVPLTYISATFTLENYEEDGVVYNGDLTFSMTVTGVDQVSMTVATAEGNTLQMTKGSVTTTFTGMRTIDWLEGISTPGDDLDDIFQLSGYSDGVSSTGSNYYSTILTPIVMSPSCDYIMGGSQQILNYYETENQTSLTMTYNVDANGNELAEPTCNSYFKLRFVSGIVDITLVLDMNEF